MFTLAKFVSKTVSDSAKQQSHDNHVTVTTVLALATSGGVTKNRNDSLCVVPPKVANASTVVTVTWLSCNCCLSLLLTVSLTNFANVYIASEGFSMGLLLCRQQPYSHI